MAKSLLYKGTFGKNIAIHKSTSNCIALKKTPLVHAYLNNFLESNLVSCCTLKFNDTHNYPQTFPQ